MDFRPFEEACQRFPLTTLIFQRLPAAVPATYKHVLLASERRVRLSADIHMCKLSSPWSDVITLGQTIKM